MNQPMRDGSVEWEKIARRVAALPAAKRASFLTAMEARGVAIEQLPIVPMADGAPDRMSPAQRRLWFLWRLDPNSVAYVVGGALALDGALDENSLERALTWLVARHDALRTIFEPLEDGDARPVALPPTPLAPERADVSNLSRDEAETRAREIVEARVRRPFDLTKESLLRAGLARVGPRRHLLWLAVHHIVCDGWSMDVLVEELAAAYAAFARGEAPVLSAPPIRYADYAAWQHMRLDAGDIGRQLDWWKAELGESRPPLALPADRPRPPSQSFRGARRDFAFDPETSRRIRDFARGRQATVFMALLAAFHALLSRLSGEDDICVGVSSANRARPETARLVGFFVTTQVIRARVLGAQSFRELLERVKAATLAAQTRQDVAFETLVEALQPERSLGHNPLFQAKFTQQLDLPATIEAGGLAFSPVMSADNAARFDLSLDFVDRADRIEATFAYATDLFDAATIDRFADLYVDLVADALKRSERPLREWTPSSASRLAGPAATFPHRDVLAAFAASVAGQPGAIALKAGAETLSFAGLNEASSRVALALRARGVGREDVVAVLAGRSLAFVVALLGIMKAGGAYAPLDPKQPARRRGALVSQCRAQLTLFDRENARAAAELGVECVSIDDLAATEAAPAPLPRPFPDQAAYLIFTSGSTGAPKGVVVPHRALANYVQGVLERLALPADASFGMVSTVAADLGHTVLFGALCSGRVLHLLAEDAAFDADRLADYVQAEKVGALKLVPSHLQGLLATPRGADALPRTALVLGGEALAPALVEAARRLKQGLRTINHYGPTETTVGVLTHEPPEAGAPAAAGGVPIGRPLPNVEAMILDADLNLAPLGVIGEIYVGGAALARGYCGQGGASAERFVPDPFHAGGRLYRTGDFARVDASGDIVFIGRRDDQVKIRGHRVELQEVAGALRRIEGVGAAEVLLDRTQAGREWLVAYVVAQGVGIEAIRDAAAAILPAHMVPSRFVPLERMPLTANGKLDRARLPACEAAPAPPPADVNINGEAERILTELWSDVLRRDDFGVNDNFFALGGDSILTLQIIARAKRRGLKITPKQIFEAQTIAALARIATPLAVPQASPSVAPSPATPLALIEAPLTPIQMAFFARPVCDRSHWNQSALLIPRTALEPTALAQALAALVARHDALRLRFSQRNGRWLQHCAPAAAGPDLLRLCAAADEAELTEACEAAQRSLDIEKGPLIRGLLVAMPDGSARLMLAVHHLAVDGVSWRILLDDLALALEQLGRGEPVALPAVETSFCDYARKLFLEAHSEALRDELDHWRVFAGVEGVGAVSPLAAARRIARVLDPALTRKLSEAPARGGPRLHEAMIAALVHALGGPAGGTVDLWLEGHGRGESFAEMDLGRTIGWLTTLYPIRLRRAAAFDETLACLRADLAKTPREGAGYGLLRWRAPDDLRGAVAAPRGPVFNYLGRFDSSLSGDALFQAAPENAGAERDPEAPLLDPLRLDARVIEGALRLDWTFDPKAYGAEEALALADAFEAELGAAAGAPSPGSIAAGAHPSASVETGEACSYPLGPMQQGLVFQALLAPDDAAYVNLLAVTVRNLDAPRFRQAWRETVARHEALRTVFRWRDGGALSQIVLETAEPAFEEHDWRGFADIEARLARLGEAERRRGLDLAAAPPMRFILVRLDESDWSFLWIRHHALLDGWSTARVLSEAADRYRGLHPPKPPARFADYIAWLEARDGARDETFWRDALKDVAEPFRLSDEGGKGDARGRHVLRLDADRTERLRAAAGLARVTLNSLVQGAWALLLQRRSLRRRVVFGVTVAGRPEDLPGALEMVGLFINTLPVAVDPRPDALARDYLAELQALNVAIREHQYAPLHEIQGWSGAGGEALFDTILVFENYPVDPALTEAARTAPLFADPLVVEDTHYPLTLTVEVGAGATFRFGYAGGHFSSDEIIALAEQFDKMLAGLCADLDRPLGQIGLAPIKDAGARAPAAAAGFTPIHESIRRQAESAPDRIALRGPDRVMTYGALEQRSNAIAKRLAGLGVGRGAVVGVLAERGADMVATLLGVLKAGGAYAPLDPDYPAERLAFMAADAKLTALVAQETLRGRAPQGDFAVLTLEEVGDAAGKPPEVSLRGEDLAYVIYTSGSTGRPKGVMIGHGALANVLAGMAEAPGLSRGDRLVAATSLSFDISALELFLPLAQGAELWIAGKAEAGDARALAALIDAAEATILQATPARWRQLMAIGWSGRPGLKALCGGEVLPADLAAWLGARCAEVWNLYGPTEATIWSAAARVAPGGRPPLGGAVSDTALYVLDDALEPVPMGAAGELFIAGAGLARGYRGRPGLTAERFAPNPFGRPGERMYRTGDIVRRRSDGGLDYLNRRDHQVKIRGYRIELGEIEAALLEHPSARAAAAIAESGGLLAYVVAEGGVAEEALLTHLAARLPAYMLPARILTLDRLPMTPNGKLDRAALPRPTMAGAAFAEPRGDLEKAIARIWSALLGVEGIGRDAHFFRLRGHSLTATRMIARIENELGVVAPLKTVFEAPTLKEFAARIEALDDISKSARVDALMAELDLS